MNNPESNLPESQDPDRPIPGDETFESTLHRMEEGILTQAEYERAEGITQEFKEQRQAGTAPSTKDTLREVENQEAEKSRAAQWAKLSQEGQEIKGSIERVHADIMLHSFDQKGNPEFTKQLVMAAEEWRMFEAYKRSYEEGLLTETKFIELMTRTWEELEKIDHHIVPREQ